MRKGWLRTALFYVAVLVVVAALGVWLGSWLGLRKAEASREMERAKMQSYLVENMQGIERGSMFPDIPVWSADGTQAFGIHELLPHGGVLVYVASGCNSCIDALEALKEAQEAAGARARAVIVILDGSPDSLAARLRARDLEVSFYHDVEQSFAHDFHVGIFPASFVIADGGVLTDMIAGTHTREDFDRVLVP
jgi:hypothetical protein